MPKRIDFAKTRRSLGRSLNAEVREFAQSIQPLAQQQGIDLQARLDQASAQQSEERRLLAEHLQESVVPVFIGGSGGKPERIGSCVLVRLGSDYFAFTAAHVIRDSGTLRLFAPSESKGGRLLPFPSCTAHLSSSAKCDDLDLGVFSLSTHRLGVFQKRVFLTDAEIDQNDRLADQEFASFYFVLSYSASKTQVKVSQAARHIYQQSFQCSTSAVNLAEYVQEKLLPADHILLDFDHEEIVVKGRSMHPPKLHGASGGGIFHISRKTNRGPLVAIVTQHRRTSRLIVGTRIKHFLAVARELRS